MKINSIFKFIKKQKLFDPYIIAEIGVNQLCNQMKAKELIYLAKKEWRRC